MGGVRARSPKSTISLALWRLRPALCSAQKSPRATRSAFGAWPLSGEGGRVGLGSGRRVVRIVDGGWQFLFFVYAQGVVIVRSELLA